MERLACPDSVDRFRSDGLLVHATPSVTGDAVLKLVGTYIQETAVTRDDAAQIMNALYEHRAKNLSAATLGEILDKLTWCLHDPDGALSQVREEWLESTDRGRVEVALSMLSTFPFIDASRMREVFDQISSKWPDLAQTCRDITEQRRAQSREQ